MNKQAVVDCWKAVFPNSSCRSIDYLDGTSAFVFRLAKDRTEVANNIMGNDPLYYMSTVELDGAWVESSASLSVKPTESYLAYSSVKIRKKTIKDVTTAKLIKRFQEVRAFIMENAGNLKDPMFDITTK